uniref:Uncharacterized protein n=2 Tax=Clytia hemisphaerica TaxID=252671 RepID=A0A7M5V7I2_9CNID
MVSLQLQLETKLWIADLHDLDQAVNGKKLTCLRTYGETLNIKQHAVFANSYRKCSPMITVEMSTQGYIPSVKDLVHVLNIRSCFKTDHTILAGSYWENEIKDTNVIQFYEKYLLDDPAVLDHCKSRNKGQNNNLCKETWSWKQSFSNFPFLLFTSEEPQPRQLSLSNRNEVDCIIYWDVNQSGRSIGKALFLPYEIPDMVGEVGIAVFRNTSDRLLGIYMCEQLRDRMMDENCVLYREAQETSVQSMLFKRKIKYGIDPAPPDILSEKEVAELLSIMDNGGDLPDDWEDDFVPSPDYDSEESESESSVSEDPLSDNYIEDDEICSENDATESDDSFEQHDRTFFSFDGKTPKILYYAKSGALSVVKREALCERAYIINVLIKRTEKKGAELLQWHDDTPLIAAARNGHFEIVHHLLSIGADPTLESSHASGTGGNAIKAASENLSCLRKNKDEILKKCFAGDIETIDPKAVSLDILYRIKDFQDIIDVLKIAESHWQKAPYFSARFSNERQRQLRRSPNKPLDQEKLKEMLDEFKSRPLIMDEFDDLVASIVEVKKNQKKVLQEQQKTSDCSDLNQRIRDGICASSARCSGSSAAKGCQLKCCGKCCPGPCKRHHLKSTRVFQPTRRKEQMSLPYHPAMKSPTNQNIKLFALQNDEWDEETSKDHVLLSGETICIVRRKKIFETGKVEEISFMQTYAYGVLINQNCSYSDRKCKDRINYGGHSDNLNAKFESQTTKKINDKLGYFLYTYKRQMESFTPVVEKVFAEGYIYPMIKEDRSLKVRVTNLVSFGNLQDAQHKIPQQDFPERHGYVNTVRHFKPGYYYTTVIK